MHIILLCIWYHLQMLTQKLFLPSILKDIIFCHHIFPISFTNKCINLRCLLYSTSIPREMQNTLPIHAQSNATVSSPFQDISVAPPNAIFLTKANYLKDSHPDKLDLGIGAYRTDEGKPFVLSVVKKAEQLILSDSSRTKEYLPIGGMPELIKLSQNLILGNTSKAIADQRVAGIQTLSGTGALRVLCEFLSKFFPNAPIYLSRPTWGNHDAIAQESGLRPVYYSYWDSETRGLDLDGMLGDLLMAPNRSIIVLHACAHNPTGVDPTEEQWDRILQVVREKHHIPLFDSAYQGFATGDLDNDAKAVRKFVDAGVECLIAQSFAKNLGLYGERVGCASVVCKNEKIAKAVRSQLELIVRAMYSNPPRHGAAIVTTVLSDPVLFEEWKQELLMMSGRIKQMRSLLHSELSKLGTPSISGDWDHIVSQIGMFSFTGLSPDQVEKMIQKHHVYMLKNGRISMAGVTTKGAAYLARAIDDVVRN